MFIFVQMLGLVAFILLSIGMQMKKKNEILFFQILSSAFYALQYFLLNAFSAMMINFIAIVRNIVFFYKDKYTNKINKKLDIIILLIFICISILIGILTYKNMFSLLPIMANIVGICTTWQQNTKLIRFGMICVTFLWIVYNISALAYSSAITSTIVLISTMFSIYKNDYKKVSKVV